MSDADFSTFSTYTITKNPAALYDLGNGAIRKLADYFGHELPAVPTVENLFELVGKVGSNKELRLNVPGARAILGGDATTIATKLLTDSGIMRPLYRPFTSTAHAVPEGCSLVITGGTANWMLRREAVAARCNPRMNPALFLAMGSRYMQDGEHPRVETLALRLERQPTEAEFAKRYMLDNLLRDGFKVQLHRVASTNGDDVMRSLLDGFRYLLDTQVLIIGNAPGAWQSVAQFRAVARELNPNFDSNGDQLFVRSDKFSVAEYGDGAADAQNPISGLGALARAAAFILKTVLN
jgi:hypothetical protein